MEYVKKASRKIGKVVGSGLTSMSSKNGKEPNFEIVHYLPMSSADPKALKRTKEILHNLLVLKGTLSVSNLELLMKFCANPVENKTPVTHFGQLLVPREVLEEEFGMSKLLSPVIERACTIYQIRIKREELEQREAKERRSGGARVGGSYDDSASSVSFAGGSAARLSLNSEKRLSLNILSGAESGSGYDEDAESVFDEDEQRVVNSSHHRSKSSKKSPKSKSTRADKSRRKKHDRHMDDEFSDDGNESDVEDSVESYSDENPAKHVTSKSKSRRKSKSHKKRTPKKVYGVPHDSEDE